MEEITKTSNELINDLLDEKISLIIRRFENTKNIDHTVVKGTSRETIIIKVLKEVLPEWVGVSSGIIIDRDGQQSPQMDIVVYNKNVLPAFFEDELGFFPIESIIEVLEVKSISNATNIKDAIDKFNKLFGLKETTKII